MNLTMISTISTVPPQPGSPKEENPFPKPREGSAALI
jgi:hypothetical protein